MPPAQGGHLRRWLLSLPPVDFLIQQLRETLIGSLKCGPIPEHVAFVMDGNRRYARKNQVETVEGHHMGFEALARVLEVCYKSGVRVVTIYAFSIENFKRSKYEVDGLMDMAKTRLVQMSEHGELLDRYGASVRILGDRSLMREDVLEQVDKAVHMTRHNSSAVLNVCFPYTGREEITHSIRETVREFSEPPPKRPQHKRPFSETHIQRNILTRQLPSLVEEEPPQQYEQHSPQQYLQGEQHHPSHNGPHTPTSHTRDHSLASVLQTPTYNTREDGTMLVSDADSADFSEPDLDRSSNLAAELSSSHTSRTSSPTHKSSASSSSPTSAGAAAAQLPDAETITADILTRNTYTADAPPLDLMIRTSGVQRLSDFLLWQCHEKTEIRFLDCLWPEFDLWHFLPVLVEWQWKQRQNAAAAARVQGQARA